MQMTLNKKEKRIFGIALILFFLFFFLLVNDSLLDRAADTDNLQSIGQIIQLTEDVRQKSPHQYMWTPINNNVVVHLGDTIYTGPKSSTKIKLDDGSEILIEENSLVVLSREKGKLNFKFKMGEGKVLSGQDKISTEAAAVAPLPPPPPKKEVNLTAVLPPKIATPTDHSIRTLHQSEAGSTVEPRHLAIELTHPNADGPFEIQLSADPDFSSFIDNPKNAKIKFSSSELEDGKYYLRARQLTKDPRLKSAWSPKVEFSLTTKKFETGFTSPKLKTPVVYHSAPSKHEPHIIWGKVKNAAKYILEVSSDKEFSKPARFTSRVPDFTLEDYRAGKSYFRVFAATEKGTRGPSSQIGEMTVWISKPQLSAVPPKTILGKDPDDTGTPEKFPVKWTKLPIAKTYEIQIDEEKDFKKPKTIHSREPASVLSVDPGKYHWRVRPLASNGEPLTAYSEPGKIEYTLKVPLATPKILEPTQNKTLFFQKDKFRIFWVEWKPVRQAEKYSLQFATDPDFNHILIDVAVDTNRYLVKKLPQGKVYWRLRATNSERVSNWSVTQKLRLLTGKTGGLYQRDKE